MGDADDQHDEYTFAHFVNHAVIAHAKPAQAPHIALERIAEEWILCMNSGMASAENGGGGEEWAIGNRPSGVTPFRA